MFYFILTLAGLWVLFEMGKIISKTLAGKPWTLTDLYLACILVVLLCIFHSNE